MIITKKNYESQLTKLLTSNLKIRLSENIVNNSKYFYIFILMLKVNRDLKI